MRPKVIPKVGLNRKDDIFVHLLVDCFPPCFVDAVSRISQSVVPGFVYCASKIEKFSLIVWTTTPKSNKKKRFL